MITITKTASFSLKISTEKQVLTQSLRRLYARSLRKMDDDSKQTVPKRRRQ